MDSETKRLILCDLVRLREQSQAASIVGYDQAAAQLLELARDMERRLGL